MNPRRTRTLRNFRRRGPLLAVAAAGVMLLGIGVPAYGQFFPFGGPPRPPAPIRQAPPPSPWGGWGWGGGGGGGGGWFGNEQPRQPPPQVDYSHAPKPEKTDNVPERTVLVLGDSMADWLAYGLEDAFKEQPDMGVLRRHKTVSGLIKYQPKGEPSDWVAAAKQIVPAEKADVIVVMLGLQDRVAIRDTDLKPEQKPGDKKKADAKGDGKSDAAKNEKNEKPADAAKADTKPDAKSEKTDADQTPADDDAEAQPIAPEKTARVPGGLYEFRDDRWVELYNKKIDDMIAVMKTKGVPIVWVGLPAVRGPKTTADMLFLDSLYREAANKAGITYVDVWDGFVDEGGRYMQRGPDFEGQPRKLRTDDGVYFTTAGARKLAHYVDREIERVLANRSVPIALPNEPGQPDTNIRPGAPAPRPLAGPIVPLTAAAVESDSLLGGPGSRPAQTDPLAQRTLVKGEALPQEAGRADDYAWPHRDIAPLDASTVPTANAAPESTGKQNAGVQQGSLQPGKTQQGDMQGGLQTLPQQPKKKQQQQPTVVQTPPPSGFFPFFRRPVQPQVQQPPRPPGSPQPQRPPGYINRAASNPPPAIAR
jgi:hypothetical protein